MKDRSSLRHNANAAKRPQCGTAGDHPGAAQTTGVRHVNLGNRIGSRASAAAGFSSDRSANCERRPSRAVLSRRCATRCGCLSEAGGLISPRPKCRAMTPARATAKRTPKRNGAATRAASTVSVVISSPSPTQDCVAPQRGRVHLIPLHRFVAGGFFGARLPPGPTSVIGGPLRNPGRTTVHGLAPGKTKM
jgi:hypothetical protein